MNEMRLIIRNNMKKIFIISLVLVFTLTGCGGSSHNSENQIDVMGRAAINTALINTFADDASRNLSENEYNRTNNSDRSYFKDIMASQLAIYDSLAGECGDNPLTNRASANPTDGLAVGEGRYDFIASVFADDQIYVNSLTTGSEGGQCSQYLAAELGVVGIEGLGDDCGGRTPLYDVIQTTYSAVAVGSVTGVDDGIISDNVSHSTTVFPFLASPRT